jgi:hypothetical protein
MKTLKEEDMKNSGRKLKIVALVAIIAIATAGIVIRVRAQVDQAPPEPDKRIALFGMTGITRTQTARISVANLTSPPDPEIPPDPCRVVMAFVDAAGNVLRNSDGQPVRREVMLEAGRAAFLQINGSEFISSDGVRINLRPIVRVFQGPPDPERTLPPDPCVPTLEIIDNGTAKTSLLFAGTPNLTPPDPNLQ